MTNWPGPVRSAYGQHLVRLRERQPGALPPLDDQRDRVIRDWQAESARTLTDDRIAALRGQYTIDRPTPEALAEILK